MRIKSIYLFLFNYNDIIKYTPNKNDCSYYSYNAIVVLVIIVQYTLKQCVIYMDKVPLLNYCSAITICGDYYYCDYRNTSRNVLVRNACRSLEFCKLITNDFNRYRFHSNDVKRTVDANVSDNRFELFWALNDRYGINNIYKHTKYIYYF